VIPSISVIVLNFNGRRWLDACLTALAAQPSAPPFEVLLADNGSTDDSIAFVAAHFPSVRIVEHRRNLGFAQGNNAAARAASGQVLAFLNNDTVPDPDWLARLHAAHASAPPNTLVTSRLVVLDDPQVIDSAGDGYLRAGGAYKRGHGDDAADFAVSEEVFGACGAAFMLSRALFEQLGGFDERFFMVYEDVDLSYRARLAGARCWYAADAVVRHAGSGTLGRASTAAVYYGQRNLEWTWLKNTPASLVVRTFPLHAIYSLAGIAHYVRLGLAGAVLRAKLDALAGVPRVLAQRRAIQAAKTADAASIEPWLDRGWVEVKRREKRHRRA
jgi:GT2 family glycosyltransferase